MSLPATWLGALLALLGVIVAIWGLRIAKLIVSLTFGLALGYLLYAHSAPSLKESLGGPALFLLGLLLGALIGFSTFKLALSLLAGFLSAHAIVSAGLIANQERAVALLSLALAAVIYYLVDKLLAAVFALAGALLLYYGLETAGLEGWIPLLAAAVVFIVGLVRQRR
uniref:DUF4203 domain-containing protein n=1 Tax=Thermofilum pendens TaxID=2269 RepID=A0A7J3X7T9_THEPE